MKYLVEEYISFTETESCVFDTMEEAEACVEVLRRGTVPYKRIVIYSNETKDALRIIRGEKG